jgi:predicted ATPase
MARIEGVRVRNYRAIRDITLGRLWNERSNEALTPLTVVIGKNGVGKSTLFDAFGFLSDCLRLGVEEACDHRGRGGFERIRSQGVHEPIEFEIYYKEDVQSRPITYEVAIDIDEYGRPYVARERLRQRRRGQSRGWPFSFLILNTGQGFAWKGENLGVQEVDRTFTLTTHQPYFVDALNPAEVYIAPVITKSFEAWLKKASPLEDSGSVII